MSKQRSVFDIVGPVMIGPSSSHTAGAARLGALARAIIGQQPKDAVIVLHGSFATTGTGHGTDLALVAGLLGFAPDDDRIPNAFEEARAAGMTFEFTKDDLGDVHPNTVMFVLDTGSGEPLIIQGASLGGGSVIINRIGDYSLELRGDYPTLIVGHIDRPGQISRISGFLAEEQVNIAEMRVARTKKGADAIMLLECDTEVSPETVDRILALDGVLHVRAVPKI